VREHRLSFIVLDAASIDAAHAAEHCEIARYRSLIASAKQLGRNDCGGRRRSMRKRLPTRS